MTTQKPQEQSAKDEQPVWDALKNAEPDFIKDCQIIKETFNVRIPEGFRNYRLGKFLRKFSEFLADGGKLNGFDYRADHCDNAIALLVAGILHYDFKRKLIVGSYKVAGRWLKAPCDNEYLSQRAGLADRTRDNCIHSLKVSGYYTSQERREIELVDGFTVFSGKTSIKRLELDSIAEQIGATDDLRAAEMFFVATNRHEREGFEAEFRRAQKAEREKKKAARKALARAEKKAEKAKKLTKAQEARKDEQIEYAARLRSEGWNWRQIEQTVMQKFGFVLSIIRTPSDTVPI
ncbi:hypothetical protein P7F88_25205 [Vibrio hannami]|uniref:hypothetical protein n=1 Tax=Vibrio hannami TaxID=2717094 RepID=UPI00240FC7AD|nr:hypothetical protein [Vibrio hannami]MDG3089163.1 hypothetical protein [Vibrio hannami]